MPYAPASKRRKQAAPKRRVFKKTARSELIVRPIVPAQENLFSTTRRIRLAVGLSPTTVVTDNGGFQTTYGLSFQLSDLPNWQEYTSLFDQFRITGAEVEFQPRYTDNVGANDNNLITLGWFQDSNNVDLTGLTSVENPWLERTGYRQTVLDKIVKVKLTPRPQAMVYRTVTTTGYQVKDPRSMNEWLASTDYLCPHYGLYFRVYAPDATASSSVNMVHVYVNLSLQFKSTR